VLVAINWLTYVWAVTHGRTLDASLGYFLLPLFNVALGVLLLGERLVRGEWLGVGLAATGVVFLALVSPRLPWVALVLAASFSTYGLVKKRTELPAAEGMALETGLLALPALAVLGWLAARGQLVFGTAGAGMDAWLVSTGLITTVPLVAFAIAARRLTLAALGMLQYISPTLQFLLGVLVLQEPVDARRLAGFAVVWLGLIVFSGAAWRRHRAKRQEPPAD
jgi:chloramphenicol-sensitive protein RarD